MEWLFAVPGLFLGGLMVFFLTRGNASVMKERVRMREESIAKLEAELSQVREEHQRLLESSQSLREEGRELRTRLSSAEEAEQEKAKLLEKMELRFADTFKALSSDALKANNAAFMDLAKKTLEKEQESAKGEMGKGKLAIEALLKPVYESLKQFDEQVGKIEKERVGAYEGLKEQVSYLMESQHLLRAETSNLVKALGTPRVRGKWGEIQLRTVVEMAGMLEHCDFEEQQSSDREDGSRARPDMVIRLPGDKRIIVDAKAPLEAFLLAIEADTPEERKRLMKEHARHIRAHIKDLGERAYWAQYEASPEFVVLFLPGENFFSAALEVEPGLIDEGVRQKVILATPTTLIALLKVVAYGWRQEGLAAQAQEVGMLGKELYERISDVANNWMAVGKGLKGAVEHYNKAVYNLESKVLVSARRFRDLPLEPSKKSILDMRTVDQVPRELQSPELGQEDG